MKMTWTLTEVPAGTEVAIRGENVPAGLIVGCATPSDIAR
jgi:hypothetical protein